MSEPDHFLAEAAKLFDTLRERVAGPRTGQHDDDVWERAVRETPSEACCRCPICRAIAASRGSGVTAQLTDAGRSLFTALGKVLEAVDQPVVRRETRPPGGWPGPDTARSAQGETLDAG